MMPLQLGGYKENFIELRGEKFKESTPLNPNVPCVIKWLIYHLSAFLSQLLATF